MEKEVWVSAIGFDGESLADSRVDRDEVMAYASDIDMKLLDEREGDNDGLVKQI